MYGIIPLLIALFFLARYIIKFIMKEFVAWTSGFLGETAGYSIDESTIGLGIAVAFVIIRIVMLIVKGRKNNKSNHENTK
jgi:sorbitol-specific phosphotransferase system component IIC